MSANAPPTKRNRQYDVTHAGRRVHAQELVKLANERSRYRWLLEEILRTRIGVSQDVIDDMVLRVQTGAFSSIDELLPNMD